MPFVPDKPANSRFTPDALKYDDTIPQLPGTPERADQDAKAAKRKKPTEKGFMDKAGEFVDEVTTPFRAAAGTAAKGLVATGENLVSGVTGVGASLANLTNAATGAKELLKNDGESDADFYKRSRAGNSYAPRTEGGREMAENAAVPKAIGKVVEEGGKGFSKVTGSEAAGELFKDATAVGMAAAPALRPKSPTSPRYPATEKVAIPDEPVKGARAFGYNIRPSDAAKAQPEIPRGKGMTAEKFAGSDDLRKTQMLKNQKVTTRGAAEQIGLPSDTPRITPKLIDAQAAPHLAKYRQVGRAAGDFEASAELPTKLDAVADATGLTQKARADIAAEAGRHKSAKLSGPDLVKTISVLRRKAVNNAKSKDVDIQDFGIGLRKIAGVLEGELETRLTTEGESALMKSFRESRQELAKIHDVESATRGGQVDAAIIHRLSKKDVPLSGNLKIIADSYEMFPHVLRHPQTVSSLSGGLNPALSLSADVLSLGARPGVRAFLNSETYQNTLGKAAPREPGQPLGPSSALGDYFSGTPPKTPPSGPKGKPPAPVDDIPKTPASSMLEAQKRSGDLSLADEVLSPEKLPEAPSRLQAETPPAVRGDIDFKASEPLLATLAEELGIGTAPEGALPGGRSPRAPGRAGDLESAEDARVNTGPGNRVGGNRMTDDSIDFEESTGPSQPKPLQPFREGVEFNDPGALGQFFAPGQMREAGQYLQNPHGLSLADDLVAPDKLPPAPPRGTPTEPGPTGNPGFSLADDLGIEVLPSTGKRGGFMLKIQGKKSPVSFSTEAEANQAALNLADDLLGGKPDNVTPMPKAKENVRSPLENNASGESSASVEAINRGKSEKAAGRDRFTVDADGNVSPLEGVDSADATAPKGSMIVQRGIGDKEFSILDRGGLSKTHAEGLLNRAMGNLKPRKKAVGE